MSKVIKSAAAFAIILVAAVVFLTGSRAFAHKPEDGAIHATVAPLMYTLDSTRDDFTTNSRIGLGIIAEADLDKNGGVEITIQHLRKVFSLEQDRKVVTELGTRMYITMGYRHWLTEHFSGALAFFSSYTMGEPHQIRNDFTNEPTPPTSAHDATDYGFDFSLQAEPVRVGRFSVIVDARYSLSVTAKAGEKMNHYGALIGLKYFVQSRTPVRDE